MLSDDFVMEELSNNFCSGIASGNSLRPSTKMIDGDQYIGITTSSARKRPKEVTSNC